MAARRVSLQATLAVLALSMAAAGGLFALKHTVRDLEQELASVRGRIDREQWALRAARADLEYLLRPDRLAMQAPQLGLVPATGGRIVRVEELPTPMLLAGGDAAFPIPLPSGAEAQLRFKPFSLPGRAVQERRR